MSTSEADRVDLHTHTYFSDGKLSPEELVELAAQKGLAALALTDHDNVDGLERFLAAGAAHGVETVPGVELSCVHEDLEVHMVGLFIQPTEACRARLTQVRTARTFRMQAMLERLQDLGIDLTIDDIPQEEGKSFGRPHLARALVAKGVVQTTGEAFARYIGDDGPAYVPKTRLSAKEGIDLIHDIQGVSVLAHPGMSNLMDRIPDFASLGVDAVESFYWRHSADTRRRVETFCAELGLGLSGGSDFHGQGEGGGLGDLPIPYQVLEDLRALRGAIRKGA